MSRFPRNLWLALKRPVRLPLPSVNQVMACISLLGLVGLSFMGGAAVMYFRLPPADFFDRAFTGAEAWHERGRLDVYAPAVAPRGIAREEVRVDRPGRTWDGFTLVTTTAGSRAKLLDMRGHVVHRWELPFHKAWPHAPHVADPLPDEQIHWFRCHLFPNGDLLAVYHALGDTPYGYGLVKIDKDSRLLWAYAGRTHHDVEVGEDGTIYTLGQTLLSHPPAGLEFLPSPIIAESVVILSPDGKERDSIPLLEAFRDSPYAALVFDPPPDRTVPHPDPRREQGRPRPRQQRPRPEPGAGAEVLAVQARAAADLPAEHEHPGGAGPTHPQRGLGRPGHLADATRCGLPEQRTDSPLR
jgi:hypothetical protein